jgi:hypothetical protein
LLLLKIAGLPTVFRYIVHDNHVPNLRQHFISAFRRSTPPEFCNVFILHVPQGTNPDPRFDLGCQRLLKPLRPANAVKIDVKNLS